MNAKGDATVRTMTKPMAGNRAMECYQSYRLVLSMLIIQIISTGLYLLSRIILSTGSFVFALITYRHIVAAFCVAPFAVIIERRNWNNISGLAWFWIFINSFTGIIFAMGLYYFGLRDTNATYATNFLNLIPAVTFAISVTLRIDKLRLRTKAGWIKMTGALLCVVGALIISLYKGPGFFIDHHKLSPHVRLVASKTHWLRGSLFLLGSCLSYSIWFIIQVKLYKVCPLRYTTTTLTCLMAAAQASVVGLCLNRSGAAWTLRLDLQLVTIVYSGVLATAATFCLISFVVSLKGPTYPPMFNPLSLIFTAVLEALFLGEKVTVGCLLGMSIIIFGLYSFLWGQKREIANVALSSPTAMLDEAQQDSTHGPAAANPTTGNVVGDRV